MEVQRSQVDEVFKNMKSEDDLEETEPGVFQIRVHIIVSPTNLSIRPGYCDQIIPASEESNYISS